MIRKRSLLAGLMTAALAAAPAAAQAPPGPDFHAQAVGQWAQAQERGADQAANPEYQRRFAPLAADYARTNIDWEDPHRPSWVDPFLLDWGCARPNCRPRGEELDVEIENRYGARLHGHLSLPLRRGPEPLPAIVLLTGGTGPEHAYRGLAQGLAEAGYVVLGVSAQGDAGSQTRAPDARYCQPGDWQRPQEMGITEEGACAGETPPGDPVGDATALPNAAVQGAPDPEYFEALYDRVRARKTFAALDAVRWLLSPENPRRAAVDAERIGIAGHSLGAHAALLAGNGDPQRRFGAVVSWDGFGRLGQTAAPRVPTMFQHASLGELGPQRTPPDPDALPGARDAARFRDAGVPTMLVTLGGSTHQEWNYIPHQAAQYFNSSRLGERLGLYYTVAWFDRWLRPEPPARRRAAKRLGSCTYDDSVDRSSIGQGTFDPATGRNVPYRIEGERVPDRLSPFFRSMAHLPGLRTDDLVGRCASR